MPLLLSSPLLFAADNPKPAIDLHMEGEILATDGDSDITFRFRMPGTNDASLIRYQYKLDGVQPDWQERSDVMRLVALFHDSKNKLLSMKEVTFNNTSAGWTGEAETSPIRAFAHSSIFASNTTNQTNQRLTETVLPASHGSTI